MKGAAIQAAVLSGQDDDMVTFVEVTPVGLGLVSPLFLKNWFPNRLC